MSRSHLRFVGLVFAHDERNDLRDLLCAENGTPGWHPFSGDAGRNGCIDCSGTAAVKPDLIQQIRPDASRHFFSMAARAIGRVRLLADGDDIWITAHFPKTIVVELLRIRGELGRLNTIELAGDESLIGGGNGRLRVVNPITNGENNRSVKRREPPIRQFVVVFLNPIKRVTAYRLSRR